MAVVIDQQHEFKPPVRSQRCRLPSFTHLDFSLLDTSHIDVSQTHSLGHILTATSFPRSFSTPCLTLADKGKEDLNDNSSGTTTTTPRVELIGGQSAPKARALVVEVAIALASGTTPVPVSSGLGGAYFLYDRHGEVVAVAKPIDEEPLALNNPKGFTGRTLGQPGLKRSVRVGEAGTRELAAYLLDHGGFAGVPPTALVKFSHVKFHVNNSQIQTPLHPYKIASLQRYIQHDFDAGELGPSGFSVSSVHRIGILDVRLLNIDRHSGNILVGKYEHDKYSLGATELVPIDHGLCLPEWLDDPYFEWLHWPQALVPFSEVEMEYIANLNPFEDAELLRAQLPCLSESSIRVLVVCTIFLKRGVSAGLCLGDIGEMMTRDCRGGEESMSVLESVCARAKDTVFLLQNVEEQEGMSEVEDDDQMFQLDEEVEYNTRGGLQNLPPLVGKPPLGPKSQSAKSAKDSLNMKKIEDNKSYDGDMIKCSQVNDNPKALNLIKSISFAAPGRRNEIEGSSFGEMDEEAWEFFLDMFEKFLPEVFDERKTTGITQRVTKIMFSVRLLSEE
ncbi:hypothetical protein Cgig2_001398 [Carnegiea gigantea]|uniref:1-phosphatidylinositol 4-kinase n=1 Tax=Carnegiea gigantea TaxID=171969 RepID=A0A9Q1QPH0_9CARY|nr:hypothetical protein Cgig2_001398 [Carnegiea gigantea]